WVLLTNVVVRAEPFHRTTELPMNPLPFTVSVNAGSPATAPVGLSVVTAGAGFGATTTKFTIGSAPRREEGDTTVTVAVPALAMSAAEIGAVNWVPLTNVVVRAEPFHRTTELAMNPLPFTVSVKPGSPAMAPVGLNVVATGTGFGATTTKF